MKTDFLKTLISKVFLCLILLSSFSSFSQNFKILVFHKTNGFRHADAINASITMLEELGVNTGGDSWTVDNTNDDAVFDGDLSQYEVIVFANTSGGGLLDDNQKTAMETFIQSGKGFIGFHAATDTYRNTDDNSKWLWYNELVGGIVQTSPNHTSNNTAGIMNVLTDHVTTDHIDETWSHDEEWYYWELNGGQLSSNNTNLLEVESTGNNSYDATRPITWLKEYDGGRSFYTALGHNATTYENNQTFRTMIQKAVLWAANRSTDIVEICDIDAPIGNVIALQKSGGDEKWIAIDSDNNELIANATIDARALFEVENHDDGCIALKALYNDKYVQVIGDETTATLKANGNALGTWENFGWLAINDNQVALKSLFNNGWVSADWTENNSSILSNGTTNGDAETFNFEIIDTVLATENNNLNSFNLYPNPTTDFLKINATQNVENVTIIDLTGKVLFRNSYNNQKEIQLDLSFLANGIYYLDMDGFSNTFIKN